LRIHRNASIIAALITALHGQEAKHAAELIQPCALQADIYFLASDDLKGRNAGSPEDHIATDYIASEFMRLGLKPAGDSGTYFQKMELNTGDLGREHTTFMAKIAGADHTFVFGKDIRWSRQSVRPASACGPVVFAGYGISAPEYGYNDFAGIDVKGKVVVVLAREPQADDAASKFMGTWDTYHAFSWEKLEEIRKRGAAGLLLVQDRRRDFKQTLASSPRPAGGPDFGRAGPMWDILTFAIPRETSDQLLAPVEKTTEALQAAIDRTLRPASLEVPATSACMAKAFTKSSATSGATWRRCWKAPTRSSSPRRCF
jgi:hypothetical protein